METGVSEHVVELKTPEPVLEKVIVVPPDRAWYGTFETVTGGSWAKADVASSAELNRTPREKERTSVSPVGSGPLEVSSPPAGLAVVVRECRPPGR